MQASTPSTSRWPRPTPTPSCAPCGPSPPPSAASTSRTSRPPNVSRSRRGCATSWTFPSCTTTSTARPSSPRRRCSTARRSPARRSPACAWWSTAREPPPSPAHGCSSRWASGARTWCCATAAAWSRPTARTSTRSNASSPPRGAFRRWPRRCTTPTSSSACRRPTR